MMQLFCNSISARNEKEIFNDAICQFGLVIDDCTSFGSCIVMLLNYVYIEDITRVVISYEIYQTSLW